LRPALISVHLWFQEAELEQQQRAAQPANPSPVNVHCQKGGKAYIDGCGLRDDPKGQLFRTIPNGAANSPTRR